MMRHRPASTLCVLLAVHLCGCAPARTVEPAGEGAPTPATSEGRDPLARAGSGITGRRVQADRVPTMPGGRDTLRAALIRLIAEVQDADYRGDLQRLGELNESMARFVQKPSLAKHARYWRGFALWRRALNGLGQGADGGSADRDFALANDEFRAALRLDSAYVEAKVGLVAGLSNRVFFTRGDAVLRSEFVREYRPILDGLLAEAPSNPRLVFVAAAQQFHAPPAVGGSRQRAIEMIDRAIQAQSTAEEAVVSDLEPRWGKAELHMLLATLLLQADLELDRAERHARQALAMRPQWRAVRENLLPAIRERRSAKDPG
jgi:hypothetical protein